ncbi:VpaChn25_0724 family phage protein
MTDIGIDYLKIMREEARLVILKALAEQTNESLNSSMLEPVLAKFGIHQERSWIHGEMEWLRNMGAITVVEAGTVKIGTLTNLGRRHLDRHAHIEGVKRPSRPGE